MRKQQLLILCVLALLPPGCSQPPRKRAEQTLQKVDPARLRVEAAILYKDVFSGVGPEFVALKANAWPALFRAFKPEQVGAYQDGFALALDINREREAGIYVIPMHMEVQPRSSDRAQFEPIADGVFWYSFVR